MISTSNSSSALPISGKEDWQQIQCCDFEASFYEQSEQASSLSIQID
ncbi:hypothetical protein Gogos_010064 [Gossypium gossypioides]|uniref:Uncharacterized protein n=1 Tax=Gossypium gossypioides TaxID=34282 RepID=A0A7J9BK36_GOSGO|nr:hypothetical protein [Gossypium gossypioides]